MLSQGSLHRLIYCTLLGEINSYDRGNLESAQAGSLNLQHETSTTTALPDGLENLRILPTCSKRVVRSRKHGRVMQVIRWLDS
jgi:hypothetical protein